MKPRPSWKGSRPQRRQVETSQDARRNYDRYIALAQAEARSGDRVVAENYYQHAEHYLRTMHEGEARA